MSFFKRKVIVVDLYTDDPVTLELFKIQPTINYLPNWWKGSVKQPLNQAKTPHATLKTCQGLKDYFGTGYVIPAWSDLRLTIDDKQEYSWVYSDGKSNAEVHGSEQWHNFRDPRDFGHLKLDPPWAIHCSESIKWLFLPLYWQGSEGLDPFFEVLHGVVDYNEIHSSSINMMFKTDKPAVKVIEHGTPLVYLVPITERPIEIRYHLVNREKLQELKSFSHFSFINSVSKRRRLLRTCPFK